MKKITIILLVIIPLLLISGGIYYVRFGVKEIPTKVDVLQEQEVASVIDTKEDIKNEDTPISKEDIVREKIEKIKKRLALKGLIIEGDSYFRNDQLALALKKYLEFYKENPEDPLILKKIGNTYFEMKKYGSALNYYKKISEPETDILRQIALCLFYTHDLNNTKQLEELQQEITGIGLPDEEYIYYTYSLSCVTDFHNCKLDFQEYFWPQSGEDNQEGSKEINFLELQNIKTAIENYRNFQIDQVYLKDAYIIGAWYSDKMYPLAINMGEQLLFEKPGYKPILQIIAQSYFELGEYEKARDTLAKYYEEDDDEPNVAYMLGIINSKLREYVLGNIYLQKAIKLGSQNSLEARRQLIYNFYLLENDDAMLSEFEKMVNEEENITIADLRLAIYHHILHEKYEKAQAWSQKGQEIFTDSSDFYAYEGWILREQGDLQNAKLVFNNGLLIDESNPFLLINIAYNEKEMGNTSAALVLFKNIVSQFPESEFSTQAQKEIAALGNNS